jgi:hypothetical protein
MGGLPMLRKLLQATWLATAAFVLVSGTRNALAEANPVFVSPSNGAGKRGSAWKFAGRWNTSYGRMTLQVDGDRVTGQYVYGDKQVVGAIKGTVDGVRLSFEWDEPKGAGRGRGRFDVSEDGRTFTGRWGQDTSEDGSGDWTGTRESDP